MESRFHAIRNLYFPFLQFTLFKNYLKYSSYEANLLKNNLTFHLKSPIYYYMKMHIAI